MNRGMLCIILAVGMASAFIGCNTVKEEKIRTEESKVSKPKVSSELTGIEKSKYEISEMIYGLIDDVQNLLIENFTKINSEIDLSRTQVLLVSNLTKTAYLINNQNEEIGNSDEIIEYSTETIKDKNILTGGFGVRDFNGKETYVFNVDMFAQDGRVGNELRKVTFDTLLHEGIHIFYHRRKVKELDTVERGKGGFRSQEYPVLAGERILRAQTLNYLNKAILSENEEVRIENIKKANYFYKKYLEFDQENQYSTKYDMIEGQAKYFEFRGNAILNNPHASKEEIVDITTEFYKTTYEGMRKEFLTNMSTELEYYAIGSAAFVLIYEMENGDEVGMVNPLQYLLDKYGVLESEGDLEISKTIQSQIDKSNGKLKEVVDIVESRIDDEEYINIKIPAMRDNSKIGSMRLEMLPIRYEFEDYEGTINKMVAEIDVNGNRIKFNEALVVWKELRDKGGRRLGTHYFISVPSDDVEVDGDRITVQSEELQLYNMRFKEDDGVYTLTE